MMAKSKSDSFNTKSGKKGKKDKSKSPGGYDTYGGKTKEEHFIEMGHGTSALDKPYRKWGYTGPTVASRKAAGISPLPGAGTSLAGTATGAAKFPAKPFETTTKAKGGLGRGAASVFGGNRGGLAPGAMKPPGTTPNDAFTGTLGTPGTLGKTVKAKDDNKYAKPGKPRRQTVFGSAFANPSAMPSPAARTFGAQNGLKNQAAVPDYGKFDPMLAGPPRAVGAQAARELAKGRAEALGRIEKALWSDDPQARSMAARMLGVERQTALAFAKAPGRANTLNWIAEAQRSPNPATRRFAAEALERQLRMIRTAVNRPATPSGVPKSSHHARTARVPLSTVRLPGPRKTAIEVQAEAARKKHDSVIADLWNRRVETWDRIAKEDMEKEQAAIEVAAKKRQAALELAEFETAAGELAENGASGPKESGGLLDTLFADAIQNLYRLGVEAGEAVNLDEAADNLELYLNGEGETKRYTREQARAIGPVREAEEENQARFIGRTFLGDSDDTLEPRKLKTMEDGKKISFKDHWKKDYSIINNLQQAVTGDLDYVLGHGRSGVKSSGDFTATRNGNEIHIQGTVEHIWEDTYNFEKGVYSVPARLLEKHKGAKPFKIESGWKQKVWATVRIGPDGRLSVDRNSVKWEDMGE